MVEQSTFVVEETEGLSHKKQSNTGADFDRSYLLFALAGHGLTRQHETNGR